MGDPRKGPNHRINRVNGLLRFYRLKAGRLSKVGEYNFHVQCGEVKKGLKHDTRNILKLCAHLVVCLHPLRAHDDPFGTCC